MNIDSEVYDGWHYWRARLIESPSWFRGRPGFRYVKEQKFASFAWGQVSRSGWFSDEGECKRQARIWLDGIWAEGQLID